MGAEIAVRAATEEDAAAIQSIYAPIVTGTFASFEEAAPDVAEIVHRMLARPRLPWLVAEDAGRLAGYAYASQHRQRPAYRWSADCSVYLGAGYRGRGIGRGLYRRLVAELTELGYVSLFAGIALPNDASVGLHQAMGFQPIGVFDTSATSSAPGTTWVGGSAPCRSCPRRPASHRNGPNPVKATGQFCGAATSSESGRTPGRSCSSPSRRGDRAP